MPDDNIYTTFQRAARSVPESDAIVFEGRSLSYAELDQLALSVATGLRDLGVEPGDRVLLYAPNSPEMIATYLGCAYLGAIFAPVNPVFRAHEMDYVCANAAARVAIVQTETLDDFERFAGPHKPKLTVVIGQAEDRSASEGQVSFASLASKTPAAPQHPTKPDDPVLICYTSGTTASPKPVAHSQRSDAWAATTYARAWNLGPGDRGVVAMPIAWAYGLSACSMPMLSQGGTVLLLRRFHPVEVLEEIEAQHATVFWGTMSMYTKLLDVLRREDYDLSSLRICMNGAEASPDSAVHDFQDFTGLHLIQAYAASELRPLLATRADDPDAPFNTCGQRVPGAKIRLLGDEGREVDVGHVGEAEAWSPGMMLGYWGEPETTAQKLNAEGWLKTGDLLVEDEKGYFSVVGRRSDMIIRSGANIAPAEVESAIRSHPAVANAGVVGIPDPGSGEAVVAIVVPVAGEVIDVAELRAYLTDILASYKLPSHILIAAELPLNASGKADRLALRERALASVGADETRSGR
jgi:long-chain acyl-CoA synthetase